MSLDEGIRASPGTSPLTTILLLVRILLYTVPDDGSISRARGSDIYKIHTYIHNI